MAEYIEREKVRDKLYENDAITFEGVKILNTFPTADVVEVVRCWKCRHCDPVNKHCDHYTGTGLPFPRKETDFCSYGELKELR